MDPLLCIELLGILYHGDALGPLLLEHVSDTFLVWVWAHLAE